MDEKDAQHSTRIQLNASSMTLHCKEKPFEIRMPKSATTTTSSFKRQPSPTEASHTTFDRSVSKLIIPTSRFLIEPNSWLRITWDIILLILSGYLLTLHPIHIAFMKHEFPLRNHSILAEIFIQVVVTVDIPVSVFLQHSLKKGAPCKTLAENVRQYGRWMVWIDIASAIPVSFIVNDKSDLTATLLQFLRFVKMYKLQYISPLLSQRIFRLLTVFGNPCFVIFPLIMIVVNHFVTCGWIYLGKIHSLGRNWITLAVASGKLSQAEVDEPLALYITSLYWSFATVSTVGYGDIVAATQWEKLYSIMVASTGVLCYSFALSYMSVTLSRLVGSYSKDVVKMEKIEHFIRVNSIPDYLANKIRKEAYSKPTQQARFINTDAFLSCLSDDALLEVEGYLKASLVSKLPILQGRYLLVNPVCTEAHFILATQLSRF
jgi:hypothetical protein